MNEMVVPDTRAKIRIWWMNDDHTFVLLRTGNAEMTLCHIMECWENDPYGMVSAYDQDRSPFPECIHGEGRKRKKKFQREVRKYVENIYRDGEP